MPYMYHTLLNKEILILGCGNPLLGDDGFGPAVVRQLEDNDIASKKIGLLDAGTSVRDLLLDLILIENHLKTIIIIDAVSHDNKKAGDIFELNLDHIPENKMADYSLHQFPSSNMLKELKEVSSMDVIFLAVQIQTIPDFIQPGLSQVVEKSVRKMCDLIQNKILGVEFKTSKKESIPC